MSFHLFHTSFLSFVRSSQSFSKKEKEDIYLLFQNKTLKNIFNLLFCLSLWSFFALFFDSVFITQGLITSVAFRGNLLYHFLPSFIFLCIGISVRAFFVYYFSRNGKIHLSIKEKMLALIPLVGFIIFSALILRKQSLFLKSLRLYFSSLRKNASWISLVYKKIKELRGVK